MYTYIVFRYSLNLKTLKHSVKTTVKIFSSHHPDERIRAQLTVDALKVRCQVKSGFFSNISKITQAFVKKSRKIKITQVHATPRALNERELVNGSSERSSLFRELN